MSSLHYIAVARIADCTRIAALATPEGGISRDVLEEKAQKVVQSGRIHQHVRLTIADNQVGRIHYHSDPAFLYIVVTAAEYPQRMAFKVLSEVRHLFQHHFSDDMGLVKSCALLSKRAREPLLKIVAKYSDVTNVDKVAGVNVQVQQVKSLMQDNIQSALKNQDNLDTLLESSDAMRNEATSFHRSTNQVKDRMQWKNLKMKLLIALLFIGLILIIVVPLILNRAPSSSATAGNKS